MNTDSLKTPKTYLDVFSKEDFEVIEDVSEIFRETSWYFGAHATDPWRELFWDYTSAISDALTGCLESKNVDSPDFATVKTSLQRKLDWIFFGHNPLVTRVIALPLATPKSLEFLSFSLSQISNAIQEVSRLFVFHSNMNRLNTSLTVCIMALPTCLTISRKRQNT